MFPLKDSIRSNTFPFVNYILISLNIAVYIYQAQLGDQLILFNRELGLIAKQLVLTPIEAISIQDRLSPLITYMFLHGSVIHLVSNIYFLFIFGDNVEDRLGHYRYLITYLLFGISSALCQVLIFSQTNYPMIGASGAVAGVMGMYIIFYPKATVKTLLFFLVIIKTVEIPAVIFLGLWFFGQLVSGSTAAITTEVGGSSAWWAHIGGFCVGVLLAVYLVRKSRGFRYTSD